MARLADTRTSPPGGWRYVQFETGCVIEAGSLPELIETLIAHRKYKKLEPIEPEKVQIDIERQLCNGLEPRFCTAEPGETYEPVEDQTRGLTEGKAFALSKTIVSLVTAGEGLVDKAESKRRADICRACQFNRAPRGCSCSLFNRVIAATVPAARTEPGIALCAVCGCTLKAKILLPMTAISAGNKGRDLKFPSHCWQT